MTKNFTLKGFAELEKRLRSLGDRVAENGLRLANYEGAKVARDATKQRLVSNGDPKVITGTLAEAVSVFRVRSPKYRVTHAVGVRKLFRHAEDGGGDENAATYGRFLEFGTSRMRAHPFLRPAFDSTLNQQVTAIHDRLAKVIEREAKSK